MLPSEAVLRRARESILRSWDAACLDRRDTVPGRFSEEARASLPGLRGTEPPTSPVEVLAAMASQRLRLYLDQACRNGPARNRNGAAIAVSAALTASST